MLLLRAAVVCVLAAALAPAAAADPPQFGPPPGSWLIARVKPGATIPLRASPGGKVVARVGRRTPFGSPRAFTVFRQRGRWLAITSSELRNGRLAWVDARRGLTFTRTRYSVHADLSRRRLELRRGDVVVRSVTVGTGRAASSTPVGRFTLTDKMPGPAYGSYFGCCILAISGHQPNLPPGWIGGDRLAIHGSSNPGTFGREASAGCLHATRQTLLFLWKRLPLGTPVFIHP